MDGVDLFASNRFEKYLMHLFRMKSDYKLHLLNKQKCIVGLM